MAKGKGEKKKSKTKSTKKGKSKGAVGKSGSGKVASAATKLKALSDNPLVADVVAAALVATAAALKDSRKARELAEHAGEELQALGREGAEKGSAFWQLALDIGRRALNELAGDKPKKKPSAK